MTTHDPSNSVTCDECGKIFNTEHQRKTHVRIFHSGFRFNCDLCDAQFLHRNQLASHKIREHGEQRQHECTICGQRFIQRGHLNRHTRTYHPTGDQQVKNFSKRKERGPNKAAFKGASIPAGMANSEKHSGEITLTVDNPDVETIT